MNQRLCACCGEPMERTHTTFTVVRAGGVYVVRHAPCFECMSCGQIVFSQDAAKKLEKLTSGRVPARGFLNAWTYNWGDPVEETKSTVSKATENAPMLKPITV